ncbi:MAG: hypothetical protein JEZ05_02530 [Tenericutes bacterium]|nr:hypothetical protein [Mycoplasmatota bacterium]
MQFFQVFICLLSLLNPMQFTDLESMKTKGEYINTQYRMTYGSIVNDNTDGILVVYDLNSNAEMIRIVYDDLGFEIFTYLADIGNDEIIIVCEKYYLSYNFEIPLFKHVLLMKYNLDGEKISQIVLDEKPTFYNNHNDYLIVTYSNNRVEYINNDMEYVEEIILEVEYIDKYYTQYQGVAFINDIQVDSLEIQYPGNYDIIIQNKQYTFSYSIIVHPELLIVGEEFNDAYRGSIAIIAKGEIQVEGKPYVSKTPINDPGYYQIVIYGANGYIYTKDIVVFPYITYSLKDVSYDFIEDLVVYEAIAIYSNANTILVDNEIYNSEWITNTGVYSLIIYGVNGMEYFLSFSIYPSVMGIEDEAIYDEVSFYVFGEAKLNGETVTGDNHLETPGVYKLELMMQNNLYKSYDFTIRGDSFEIIDNEQSDFNYNYIFYFLIVLGAILILRKK